MSVKIKAKLPQDDRDGTQQYTRHLRDNPDDEILAIVRLHPTNITHNLDSDDEWTVHLGVSHVELIARDSGRSSAIADTLMEIFQQRTGKMALPLEDDE